MPSCGLILHGEHRCARFYGHPGEHMCHTDMINEIC